MIAECVLQAIEADGATGTDGLGLPGGGPALGEEQLVVDSQTVGPLLPAALLLGDSPEQLVHRDPPGGKTLLELQQCHYAPPRGYSPAQSGNNHAHHQT